MTTTEGRDPDAELWALEPEQRSDRLSTRLPRRRLGPWELLGLWILRIYALSAVAVVVYFFVQTLRHP